MSLFVKRTDGFRIAFEIAMGTTGLLRPHLGRSLLGWHPRKPSLVDGLETYFQAYLASL
jgi:hypothetical protein